MSQSHVHQARKIGSILLWNAVVFIALVIIVESILGGWFGNANPVARVPAAIWNQKISYDVSQLHGGKEAVYIEYTRDADGYRGALIEEGKPILLTIGGSTTDQRYITDQDTWQSILNQRLLGDFNILNGGVDGQSSFGHLFSIKAWHSKVLNSNRVSAVLFYFGVNDVRLLEHGGKGLNEHDNLYESANFSQKIRISLSRNSFFYDKIRNVKRRIFSEAGAASQGVVWAGHLNRQESFTDPGTLFKIPPPVNHIGFPYYVELIKNLVKETHSAFPNAKILFVQQQIPGCRFLGGQEVLDRHPRLNGDTNSRDSRCVTLGQIYLAQNIAISGLETRPNLSIIDMYLHGVIKDSGVYDWIHTNSNGSRDIGEWLAPIIRNELKVH